MPFHSADISEWNCVESPVGKVAVWGSDPGSVVVVTGAAVVVGIAYPVAVRRTAFSLTDARCE